MRYFILLYVFHSYLLSLQLPTSSVVKIYATVAIYDYKSPWQTPKIANVTGSGAIIADNKILTSAHVVSSARFIEIKKENDPKKYFATVEFVSNQADLALLKVEDEKFFENTKPLVINTNVKHRDEVIVLGYPIGGDSISTTTGVISRIESTRYVWSGSYLLAIQIDAAINSGNSGGPAVDKNNNLIGIAMMKLSKSSNIAYIVPSILIKSFLKDIEDKKVDGFYDTETYYQEIENSQLKKYYGLNESQGGILITKIDKHEKHLKVDDIILAIDDKKIASNGTIDSKFGRVSFNFMLDVKQIGEIVSLKVLRDKKIINLAYPIRNQKEIIEMEFSKRPRYIIFGGLVFTPVTKNFLLSIRKNILNTKTLISTTKNKDFNEGVAWMSTIFPNEINRGYNSGNYIVKKVNGIEVKNFDHFVALIDSLEDEFVLFEFFEDTKIVMNVGKAKVSFKQIQNIYQFSNDRNTNN